MSSLQMKKKMGLLGRSMCGREPEKEIEQLSRDDGSQYSLTGGILPPLGVNGRNSRRGKLRAHIISPFDYNYRFWETFLIFLVLYTAWVCPFEFGFLDMAKGVLAITDNVVNGFFAIDIVLTFFVAYLDKSSYLLIDDPKLIALQYAKTWLVFDVVSTIPSELARQILPLPLQTYGYFNMLRLWRLRRVSAMFARLEKDRNFNYFWIRCAKLIFVCLFAVHFAGCCFFLIASDVSDPKKTWMGLLVDDYRQESLWFCYVTSIYWSIVTVTTTGYGDLHPINEKEMVFVICYLFFVLGLQAYLIGNMTNLVVHGTGRTRQFRDTIQAASNFAHRNQLPVRLQEQMLAHLCLKYRTDSEGLQQQETVDALPKAIRSSISHHLFYSLVDSVYLFNGVSSDLIFQLVTEMKAEYFPPKEDIILQNEAPTDFYIVVTGAALTDIQIISIATEIMACIFFLYDHNEKFYDLVPLQMVHPISSDVYYTLQDLIVQRNGMEEIVTEARPGDVIGETAVLCYRPQLFTIRTNRLSQLLRMNRTSFFNLVQASVGDGSIIMNNLLQHLKAIKDPMMEEILQETEQILTRSGVEMPQNLCYAANHGDDLLLHKLLKQGSHPNEVDNSNGKTALHIAASKGNEHCVVLLLEYGADPNRRDFEGSIPLWEAIQGKHEYIVKLLRDNGADISAGDTGNFACSAAEQNSTDMLRSIVQCGGDITQPKSNGTTALHMAVCEGNSDMVKLLLEQGADIDKPDVHGWTPRALADHQGHEEIKELFSAVKQAANKPHTVQIPQSLDLPYLQKFQSESNMPRFSQDSSMTPARESNYSDMPRRRRRNNNYRNSLVGFMATVNTGKGGNLPPASYSYSGGQSVGEAYRARVSLSCPEKGDVAKVVLLPNSIQELLEIGAKKFGVYATKILTQEGAEIEDIDLIRDGDRLLLAGDAGATLPSSRQES